MHVVVREQRGLDEAATAQDLAHGPADLVFLSFSDTDLAELAAAWQRLTEPRPVLRLANLAALRHPMSVDLYIEQTIQFAQCVVVRLTGGIEYWRYGAEQVAQTCKRTNCALAFLPGSGRDDPRLAALSNTDDAARAQLDAYLFEGGANNALNALLLAARLAGLDAPAPAPPLATAPFGVHEFGKSAPTDAPLVVLVFYRSHLLASDIAPLERLAAALEGHGMRTRGLYVTSLKDADAATYVEITMRAWRPALIINATGFSARAGAADASPLDAADAPVLQVVLSGSSQEAWATSERGLSAVDLAMQVALPELDGRIIATAISFKTQDEEAPQLHFRRTNHRPANAQIKFAVAQILGLIRLRQTAPQARKLAIVLSDYPGIGGQVGHAIGLDTFASVDAILRLLHANGYDCRDTAVSGHLRAPLESGVITLGTYENVSNVQMPTAHARIRQAWGAAADDSNLNNGAFSFPVVRSGKIIVAIQPDRGSRLDRKAGYHAPDTPPRHSYAAFYLWLRTIENVDAIIHLGAHGTVEWLPGKAAAVSPDCFPAALLGGTPLIYPFIVNNPGEAAPAKRRAGAVLIGHMTPPLRLAENYAGALELERLLDEYGAADGLDDRRMQTLRISILERADELGLLAECAANISAPPEERLARLDAYLCDAKDLLIRDGLHVFGQAPDAGRLSLILGSLDAASAGALIRSPQHEREGLLAALDGRFVEPGPSGAPTRGRTDVLPTGRNLFTLDPRTIPTCTAMTLAEAAARDLLRRHRQDHGDHLRRLVIDMWGGPAMRTGGEDLALAFHLIGVKPTWDHGSARVTGIEIVPLPLLDRPRVDVTLRISGLFRDAFDTQIGLFDLAVRTLARRDELLDDNALVAARDLKGAEFRRATMRIFGAPPGDYGSELPERIARRRWRVKDDLGVAYIAASHFAYGADLEGQSADDEFRALVRTADALVHTQDHAEIDILDSLDFGAHEGGFAAAAAMLGSHPTLYHADTSRPDAPRTRTVEEEVRRVVRARAANPAWIAGMKRHGYRGAAEITRSLDGLFTFAATMPHRFDQQFEILFEATMADHNTAAFIRKENPAAFAALQQRFNEALTRDLWRPRRNDVGTLLTLDDDAY